MRLPQFLACLFYISPRCSLPLAAYTLANFMLCSESYGSHQHTRRKAPPLSTAVCSLRGTDWMEVSLRVQWCTRGESPSILRAESQLSSCYLVNRPFDTLYPGDIARRTLLASLQSKKGPEKPGEEHGIVFLNFWLPCRA